MHSTEGNEENTAKSCGPKGEPLPSEQTSSFAHFLDTREKSEHLSLAEEFMLTKEVLDYFARPDLDKVWVRLDAHASNQNSLFRFGAAALMEVVNVLVAQGELIAENTTGEARESERTKRYCLASTTLSGRIDSPFLLLSYGSLPH